MKRKKYYCPVEITIEVMGGKWKSRILYHLCKQTYRYGELKRLIPEITQKMLTQALREMEEDGLIERIIYNGKIQRVEYNVTEYGSSLTPVLKAMASWGIDHIEHSKAELDNKESDSKVKL